MLENIHGGSFFLEKRLVAITNLDLSTIKASWNQAAPGFDAEHSKENIPLWMEQIQRLMENTEGAAFLDVGTGTGFLAQMACRLGCNVTGADLSEEMLALAKRKAALQGLPIHYVLFDGVTLPFPDGSFDCVANSRLLWTLLDPLRTFREWRRVLRPGGIVLSFMRLPKVSSGDDIWCYNRQVERRLPLKYATKRETAELFLKAGFSNADIFDLPVELSMAELNPWYCIRSEKERPI